MENKEVRDWRNDQALKRYEMIAPLLDPRIDEGKRRQLREEIAERKGMYIVKQKSAKLS